MAEIELNKAGLRKVFWKDVRKDVAKVNPEFAKIVDEIDPGKDYPLYLAKYPYGSTIVDEGKFFIPTNDGSLASLDSALIPKSVKDDLQYADGNFPSSIILSKDVEIFINMREQTLPWGISKPGSLLALWKYLDTVEQMHPKKIFNITAGARSIFMLPNIGDVGLHKNLKRDFNVRLSPPKGLLDQWDVFVEITKHPDAKCTWHVELLFFTSKWMEQVKREESWRGLHVFLLQSAWRNSVYWRNKVFYDFALSAAQANRNLKPNPYLVDAVKQLFAIGLGGAAGFGVAIDDETAPVSIIQKVYVESYGLKRYIPTVIHPIHFALNGERGVVYYSLRFPTSLEFSPKSRKLSSTLHDLSELKHITSTFVNEILADRVRVEGTDIVKLVKSVKFNFYHCKPDRHGEILLTKGMLQNDKNLLVKLCECQNNEFADSGSFIRGCVQIIKSN